MSGLIGSTASSLIERYAREIASTDRLPDDELMPILMGLFGEVGSVVATSKKRLRDEDAYSEYHEAVLEEFGDAFWYLAALCRRLRIDLREVVVGASDTLAAGVPEVPLQNALLDLGSATAALVSLTENSSEARDRLIAFSVSYLKAMQVIGVDFSALVVGNLEKARGRFLKPDLSNMPTFDSGFEPEEQLPWEFEIDVTQRKSGRSYLRWNGVFIGDPLTDNISDKDGYRFHDVFHFAHAAILHWSPTFRALIKQKRKSDKVFDETQDSGRAIVVEEGLTAFVFSRAKKLNFFADQKRVSFDLLKTVQQFVRGYEVEACPASLWEIAILKGYEVFRELNSKQGGTIVGSRKDRTIEYRASGR